MLFSAIRQMLAGQSVDFMSIIAQIAAVLFIIFLILPLHEFAHGWTANKLGDPTARLEGRLTFNPIASIDPVGALAILLFGFGWAKPVPVDPRYFKKPKRDMAITAAAGPLANFLAAIVGAIIFYAMQSFLPLTNPVVRFILIIFQYYVIINVSLMVFNLLPIPPLDGSKIIGAFLSDKAYAAYYKYQGVMVNIFFMIMIMDAILGFGIISTPLNFLRGGVMTAVDAIASAPFKLFGVL